VAAAAAAAVGGGDDDDVVCAHTALSLLSCGEADLFLFDGTGGGSGREEEALLMAPQRLLRDNFVFFAGFFSPFGRAPLVDQNPQFARRLSLFFGWALKRREKRAEQRREQSERRRLER
jgi:hypothetical protein